MDVLHETGGAAVSLEDPAEGFTIAAAPASAAEAALVTGDVSADGQRWRKSVRVGGADALARRREHLFYAALKQGGALVALGWIVARWLNGTPTGWLEWSAFAVFYVLNILAMSLAYHRYFTHKSFETSKPMRYALAALAQFGNYGSLKRWVADHRRHHTLSDRPGDIHSPWVDGHGNALSGLKGLKHSHLGWAYDDVMTNTELYGKGVIGDPAIEWAHATRYFWLFVSLFVAPTAWVLAFAGVHAGWQAFVGTILVAGFLRAALALHAIAAVNSFGHVYGYQNFEGLDTARNNLVLGYLTLGEGWHNNHHAHARAASTKLRWWEVDMTMWVIVALEAVGLVWAVKRPDLAAKPARLRQRARTAK